MYLLSPEIFSAFVGKSMVSGLWFAAACLVYIFDFVIPDFPVGFLLKFDATLSFEVLSFIHLKTV